MNYGERLKELREYSNIERKITQEEIAKAIGIKRSSYNQFEQQYDIIPINRLNQIANFYNVSLDYLLCLSDIMKYENTRTEIDQELFKTRLKSVRKELNLTQKELAKILNTAQPVIANYEKGKYLITTPFLYTICSKYNISADYLLGRIDTNTLKKAT